MRCTLNKAMPRPRSLTHDAIATAALAVIDHDGLGALSMRTVAAELGMGAMSLYRYVSGRQEIERLAVDLIFRAVDPGVPPHSPWEQQVTELAQRARTAIAAHPAVIPLLYAHHQSSPSAWRWLEAVLSALTQAGFTGPQRVIACRSLQAYIIGAVEIESLGPLTGAGTAALAALPPDAHPLVAETAQDAFTVTPAQEFQQGLAILIDGLCATLARQCR
jgi:AcrR family transcriptional regulator